jgi:hypothetical protein
MITVNKQLLSGTPDDVRKQVEDLGCGQDDHEYLAGTRFRQLAMKLATCDGLAVSVITYDDAKVYELEVTLASAPHHDAIVIDRSEPGDHCQMTFERWLPISDEPGVEDAMNVIHAILAASARSDPARINGTSSLAYCMLWSYAGSHPASRPIATSSYWSPLVRFSPAFTFGTFLTFRTKVISSFGALLQISRKKIEICSFNWPYGLTPRVPCLEYVAARLQLGHHHRMHDAMALY